MRVLICGGRDYAGRSKLSEVLDRLHRERPFTCLIQGGARGADDLARLWAKRVGVAGLQFDADWQTHGKAAGFRRNGEMLTEGRPDLVVAFPGGRGTADMIRQSRAAGVAVWDVELEEMLS